MEQTPRPPIEMEKDENGDYVMKAEELIEAIPDFEELAPPEQVKALDILVEKLKKGDYDSLVLEELIRRAEAIKLYEATARSEEASRLGRRFKADA